MDNFDLRKYLAEGKLLKETKEKDYYNFLMDLGGTELAGHTFQDMMKKRNDFNSFEDFLDDEIDFFKQEGDVEIINKIKSTFLNENKLIKEELTWFIDDENSDVRYKNDAYLKEVGDKIKDLYHDISDEDLNKIIIMTGDQYSREEDFHGDSIPSNHFADAAIEIYQTDVMTDDQYNAWQASLAENKM